MGAGRERGEKEDGAELCGHEQNMSHYSNTSQIIHYATKNAQFSAKHYKNRKQKTASSKGSPTWGIS